MDTALIRIKFSEHPDIGLRPNTRKLYATLVLSRADVGKRYVMVENIGQAKWAKKAGISPQQVRKYFHELEWHSLICVGQPLSFNQAIRVFLPRETIATDSERTSYFPDLIRADMATPPGSPRSRNSVDAPRSGGGVK